MSTEKYIPEVGEEFEWYSEHLGKWSKYGNIIAITSKEIIYIDKDGFAQTFNLNVGYKFRPIPTKADVERDELVRIIEDSYSSYLGAAHIQKVGFTIPKKVKRSDIFDLVGGRLCSDNYLTSKICDLLGDLVESDV